MRIDQLEHAIRAACDVADDTGPFTPARDGAFALCRRGTVESCPDSEICSPVASKSRAGATSSNPSASHPLTVPLASDRLE